MCVQHPTFDARIQSMLNIGEKAPEFTLPDKDGVLHSLSDFLGQKVILYFYPKDNTPGCTAQACSYRDNADFYKEKNAVIIGISKDSPESHRKFIEKFGLNFLLLSDVDKVAIQAYGVWQEKKNYGKVSMGVVRTTVVIDEEGNVVRYNGKVKAKEDAEQEKEFV